LGHHDLPVIDEWKVLRDTQGFPYYYNPHSTSMSWEQPPSTILCGEKVPCTWQRQHPVPISSCEYFATKRTNRDGNLYCERCWNKKFIAIEQVWGSPKTMIHHLKTKFQTLSIKRIRGGVPHPKDFSFDNVHDEVIEVCPTI